MPSLSLPRARAAATSLALLACLGAGLLPAAAQPVLGPPSASDPFSQASPVFTSDSAAVSAASTSPRASALPQATTAETAGVRQLASGEECPSGTQRAKTLLTEGFESRTLPDPTYSAGWSIATDAPRSGKALARSVILAGSPSTQPKDKPYWPLGLPFVKSLGGRTILRFAVKGTYPAETASVSVNAESGFISSSAQWGLVTLDVSSAIQPGDDGNLDVRFANYPENPATNSSIDLDDVELYMCSTVSNVRGDFTGDAIADIVTVNSDGKLQVWPGTGALRVSTPITAGTGWGQATWVGSPGDLNADGRADLLARFANGDLLAYYGDGAGGFAVGSRKVGSGWGGMTSIVPMGDIDGDRLPDFLARDTAKNMRRYTLASHGGSLTGGAIVGTGFGAFTSLLSMGDYNGDGRFDLTGILANGDMRVYTTLPTGSLWGYGTRIGTGWTFRQVTSPGDFNNDGKPDVVAVDKAGNILTYPVLGDGRWGATVRTGSGFGAFKLII